MVSKEKVKSYYICGYCGSFLKDEDTTCLNCITLLKDKVHNLEKENKLLLRLIDMILEAQGLAIDRPDSAMDCFMGNDINDSTLRIYRQSNPRI